MWHDVDQILIGRKLNKKTNIKSFVEKIVF